MTLGPFLTLAVMLLTERWFLGQLCNLKAHSGQDGRVLLLPMDMPPCRFLFIHFHAEGRLTHYPSRKLLSRRAGQFSTRLGQHSEESRYQVCSVGAGLGEERPGQGETSSLLTTIGH